ncbi:MAG: glutamate--tRNA ligase [Planctomycetota bacterium]|nr:glutamate--tRNA ligase [Planctomycetota bacterium]
MPDTPLITPPVTRFAPSPTGHLHIGGVRTALFCWAYARRHGGRFVLRIEDTDQKRSNQDAARGILEDLAWLGIAWDDGPEFAPAKGDGPAGNGPRLGGDSRGVGPFNQSQRLGVYQEYLDRLVEADLAYPAFETAEELAAMRAEAQARKETYRYSRRADYERAAALAEMGRRDEAGEPYVVRFCMPNAPVHVTDAVLGEIEFAEQHTDDFVIRKADGFPTYHLAVVIDDELMGVTHVLRGQEHLNNTPRHVALQHALTHPDGTAFRTPVYAHMPLIFNPDGSKMSKRDKDKIVRRVVKAEPDAQARCLPHATQQDLDAWLSDKTRQLPPETLLSLAAEFGIDLPEIDVEDFRRSGYLSEALCNYLALLGWTPGMKNDDGTDLERFDTAFLCEHFSLERIGKSNAKFDREKLAAFNQSAIAAFPADVFASTLREWCLRYDPELLEAFGDRFDLAARAAQPRIKTLRQCREPIGFALTADDAIEFDPKAVKKALHKGEPNGLAMLAEFRETLAAVEPFEPEQIEAAVKAFCESREMGMGKLAQPLRVAITGGNVSPGLGETLGLVGKASALARIERCLRECQPG